MGAAQPSPALIGLVKRCRQGELGFQAAAAGMAEPTLRHLCETYAQQWAAFGEELVSAVGSRCRITNPPAGSSGDSARPGEPREAVTVGDLAQFDAEAESAYRRALSGELPRQVVGMVERQYALVVDALQHLTLLQQALLTDA